MTIKDFFSKNNFPDQRKNKSNQADSRLVRHFNWYALSAVIFLCLIALLAFIHPKYKRIEQKYLMLSRGQAELQEKRMYLSELEAINDYNQPLESSDLAKINNFLPDSINKELLSAELKEAAENNSLALQTIGFTTQDNQEAKLMREAFNRTRQGGLLGLNYEQDLGIVSVSMELGEVNYFSFKNFIKAIEESLRLYDIYYIDFQPEARTAEIRLAAYYLK